MHPMLQPLVAMLGWTFVVWFYMYAWRITLMRRMKIDPQSVAQGFDDPRNMPAMLATPAANFRNLCELPILFYATVLAFAMLGPVTQLDLQLAWGFVIARMVHSIIHCTYNQVMHRFIAYAIGGLILLVLVVRLGMAVY